MRLVDMLDGFKLVKTKPDHHRAGNDARNLVRITPLPTAEIHNQRRLFRVAAAPVVKEPPPKPDATPEAEPLRDEEGSETRVTYGSSPKDTLLSANQGNNASVINLNRESLNSAGANQQGLSGGTTA